MATSTAREENDTRIKKNLIEMQVLEDTFNSLDELESKFNMISLPENVNMIRNKNHIVFFFSSYDGRKTNFKVLFES